MAAAAWADAKNATVAYLDLDSLSPGAIYALASGRYTEQTVERVLDAAASAKRHINDSDVKEIAKAGARGGQSAGRRRRRTASGGLVFLALLDDTIAAFDDTTATDPAEEPEGPPTSGCTGRATLRGDQGPEPAKV